MNNNDPEVKEFQAYLVAEAKSLNKDPKEYVKGLGEDGLKEAYKRFQAHKKKLAQKAAHGAKLNYFKSLKNQCAEDEEVVYYRKGGSVECGCKKKEGGEVPTAKTGSAVDKFKAKKLEQGKNVIANGSTKQPTIDGTKKMQEKKDPVDMTWDPKLRKMRKMTPEEINRAKKNLADARQGKGEGEPQHKCGGKVKKHQSGDEILPIKYPKGKPSKHINRGGTKSKIPVQSCGSKINKDCNGAVAKFKAKCGSKLKKHELGGSLNGIPFMQTGTPKGGIERPDNTRISSGRLQTVQNRIPWGAGKGPAGEGPMRLFNDPYIGTAMMAMGPMAGRSLRSLGTPAKTINGVNYYKTADGKLVTALELAKSMVNIGPKLAKKVDYKPIKNSRKGQVGTYDKVKRLSYETLKNDGYFDAEGNWVNNNGINWDYTRPIFKPKYAEDIDNAFLMEGLKKGGKLN